jgi:hypothetical protein
MRSVHKENFHVQYSQTARVNAMFEVAIRSLNICWLVAFGLCLLEASLNGIACSHAQTCLYLINLEPRAIYHGCF